MKKYVIIISVVLITIISAVLVLDIIAPFGSVIENTEPDSVLADAIMIENASNFYCEDFTCTDYQELTWDSVKGYIEGFNENYYDLDDSDIVSKRYQGDFRVYLIPIDGSHYKFEYGAIPSVCGLDCIIEEK